MNKDAAEKVGSLSELAQSLARLVVVVIAGLYAVGLLIVNINLAQYGLVRLDLGRPEYIMAGVLWGSFVIISTLFGLPAARTSSHWARFTLGTFSIIIPCFFFVVINQTSLPASGLWQLITTVRVGLGGLTSSLLCGQVPMILYWRRIQGTLAPTAERSSGGLWQMITSIAWADIGMTTGRYLGDGRTQAIAWFNPMNLLTVTFLYIMSLTFYATLAFPELPRSFGGGRPPAVELVLTEMPDLPWFYLGVSVDSNSKHVGPVRLLLETDQDMVFKALGSTLCYMEAFSIQKKLIQVIVYKPRLDVGQAKQGCPNPQ